MSVAKNGAILLSYTRCGHNIMRDQPEVVIAARARQMSTDEIST